MKIPVVLPTVHVQVGVDGTIEVDVDGEPYGAERTLGREDVRYALDEISAALGTAVRVEVREVDGTTYADIATPPGATGPAEAPQARQLPEPGINGSGFRPGEEVAIAYVFARQTADDDGTASLHLPPVLLAARRKELVLVGLSSRVIASID
jgi:hypothetical protein